MSNSSALLLPYNLIFDGLTVQRVIHFFIIDLILNCLPKKFTNGEMRVR
jgi:hypothetical protein